MTPVVGRQRKSPSSITTNQAAIIALFRVINRYVGNLPRLWVLDNDAERDRRADPSEGDACDPDDSGRARCLDARALG